MLADPEERNKRRKNKSRRYSSTSLYWLVTKVIYSAEKCKKSAEMNLTIRGRHPFQKRRLKPNESVPVWTQQDQTLILCLIQSFFDLKEVKHWNK
jgi:hypothetical protein